MKHLHYKVLAYIIKYLHFPVRIKNIFHGFIKNKNIILKTKLKYSNIQIDTNIGDLLAFWLFVDGGYELYYIKPIKGLINNKTMLDIGANIGAYTLTLFKETKEIHAFEAGKKNYEILSKNVHSNSLKNIYLNNKAVSDKDGEKLKIFISPDCGGNNSAYKSQFNSFEEVDTVTIDTYCTEMNVKDIGFIKIDIEGGEFSAIIGAKDTIKKYKPIIFCEFNSNAANLAGWKLTDLYNFITDYGYKSYIITAKSEIVYFGSSGFANDYSENLLFIPD